jgi:hypothetical protein
MPTVKRIGRLRITMYFGDHPPPHFHIEGPDISAQVEVASGRIIASGVPRHVLLPALRWASDNREMLARKWNELHEAD